MGTPYQRQDVTNNISNGNIVNADDLDAEFNALQSAFAVTTGHAHDGTAGEGGPVWIVGQGQELRISGNIVTPKTNDTVDLGTSSLGFKDAHIKGTLTVNEVTLGSNDLGTSLQNKQPINTTLTNLSELIGANNSMPYFTGVTSLAVTGLTPFARTLLDDANAMLMRSTLGLGSASLQDSDAVTITGGSITGITDLAIADGGTGASSASAARSNLGLGSVSTQAASAVAITGGSMSGVTITGGSITGITDLAIADGGTGASSASAARSNLGLEIGVNVQRFDLSLESLADLTTFGYLTRAGNDLITRTFMEGSGITLTNPAGGSGDTTITVEGLQTTNFLPATLVTSTETITANNNNTTIPTSAAVFDHVASNPWSYISPQQVITNGTTVTLAHGISARPTEVFLVARCTTAQAPYAVGDEVAITFFNDGSQIGASVTANATNVVIRTGSSGLLLLDNSGNNISMTNSSWRYVVRAR